MATFNKISSFSTDGDWTNTANWGGVAPVDTDTVFVHSGDQAITGVDQSDIELATLRFAPSWTGNIGSSGTPLWIDSTLFYYEANTTAAYIDGIFSKMYFNSVSSEPNALVLNATNANTVTALYARRGTLTIGAAGTVTAGHMNPMGDTDTLKVTIASGATVANWTMSGGRLYNNAAISTEFIQSGGIVEHLANTAALWTLMGGKLIPKGGTVTTLDMYGGELDLDQGTGQRTISTINYYGGTIIRNYRTSLGGNITVNLHTDAFMSSAGETITLS